MRTADRRPPVTTSVGCLVRGWAKGVVTGGRSGLQASGGKESAKDFRSAVFVTRCYSPCHTLLRKQLVVGTSRPYEGAGRHPVPHRRNGVADRADAPEKARRATSHPMGARSNTRPGRLPRGLSEPRGRRGNPVAAAAPAVARRLADAREVSRSPAGGILTASRNRRRAEIGLAANVGDDAPQPPHLDGSAMASWAIRSTCCGSG